MLSICTHRTKKHDLDTLITQALMEMNEAGFMPDASVMSCLVAGFAMNDKNSSSSSSQVAQNLALLDWNKIRRGGGKDSGQRMNLKLDVRLSMSMSTTPKVFKDAFSAFRKMGTPSVNTNLWGMSPSTHGSHSAGTRSTPETSGPVRKDTNGDRPGNNYVRSNKVDRHELKGQ